MKELFAQLFATEDEASDPAAVCGSDHICYRATLAYHSTALFVVCIIIIIGYVTAWKRRPALFLVAFHAFSFLIFFYRIILLPTCTRYMRKFQVFINRKIFQDITLPCKLETFRYIMVL